MHQFGRTEKIVLKIQEEQASTKMETLIEGDDIVGANKQLTLFWVTALMQPNILPII